MSTQIIILVILVLGLDVYNCQYGNYGPVNNIQQSDKYAPANDVEQKYVNSGQSVLLVCDLPNNMPDGKVIQQFNFPISGPRPTPLCPRKHEMYCLCSIQ